MQGDEEGGGERREEEERRGARAGGMRFPQPPSGAAFHWRYPEGDLHLICSGAPHTEGSPRVNPSPNIDKPVGQIAEARSCACSRQT